MSCQNIKKNITTKMNGIVTVGTLRSLPSMASTMASSCFWMRRRLITPHHFRAERDLHLQPCTTWYGWKKNNLILYRMAQQDFEQKKFLSTTGHCHSEADRLHRSPWASRPGKSCAKEYSNICPFYCQIPHHQAIPDPLSHHQDRLHPPLVLPQGPPMLL